MASNARRLSQELNMLKGQASYGPANTSSKAPSRPSNSSVAKVRTFPPLTLPRGLPQLTALALQANKSSSSQITAPNPAPNTSKNSPAWAYQLQSYASPLPLPSPALPHIIIEPEAVGRGLRLLLQRRNLHIPYPPAACR